MKILGMTIGENSTAAVMIDGRIVAAASEERFSRKKNDESYPRQAIDYCLREAGIDGSELDYVGIAGLSLVIAPWATRVYTTFSIQDHVKAQHEYWYPKLYKGENPVWTDVFKDKLDLDQFPGNFRELVAKEKSYYSEDTWEELRVALHAGIAEHLGIPESKIHHLEHHSCHAAYGYWGSPYRDDKTLVLTADAYGDGLSATISVAENGKLTRVHEVKDSVFRLARLYRYITLVLGMKPNEHEYKVMGLAPYAKPMILEGPYQVFKETMYVDGLDFKWNVNPPDMYFYFKEKLEGYRFDGIAGGLQKYLEEVMSEWVSNAIKHTGVGRICFSGGIAMNVKMHMILQQLEEVDDIFVCGSGSDESLALGVCYKAMEDHCLANSIDHHQIQPLSIYLGPSFTEQQVRDWIEDKGIESQYSVQYNVTARDAAQALADGLVIGRLAGRMEFGARSLGNRSILADPRSRDTVEIINRKIKNRDFWMPFAPSVLAEYGDEYIVNPKGMRAPFMTIGFDATEKGKKDLAAGIHIADFSLRPQLVEKEVNPSYHELLTEFRNLTGVGGLLNTSFNLHGLPVVCSPDDALHVFENSEIDAILFDNIMITKGTNA